jgi:hypothetical protein
MVVGSIYGSHPIGLLYFIGPWTLDPHLKWPLVSHCSMVNFQHLRVQVTSHRMKNNKSLEYLG